MRSAAERLRDWLAEYQARGASFSYAWAMTMPRVCRGLEDGDFWRSWFEQTVETWRRAYLRQPPSSADAAMLLLLELVTGENTAPDPSEACEWCGDPLPFPHVSHKRFCCDVHRRRATRERERAHRRIARDAEGGSPTPNLAPPQVVGRSGTSLRPPKEAIR